MTTTLLRGGVLYSAEHPSATAMLIADGRIRWVGDEAGADRHFDAADAVVELDGRLVTPAFVDAHVHLSQTGLALASVDLSGVRSKIEMLDRLAERARGDDAAVIMAFGWDDSTWDQSGAPTVTEVDAAVGDRVLYASRVDGHSAVVSGALVRRAAGLRHAEGWADTGRVERAAHHVARDAAQAILGTGQRRAALRRALEHAASLGVGCVHEIGAPHINPESDHEAIREIAEEAPTIAVVPYWGELGAIDKVRELGCVGAAGDLNADGSLGSRTAALLEPYADADGCGHAYLTVAQVTDHVVACTRAGLQAGFHAIGDVGVGNVVDGMVEAARAMGLQAFVHARHRVEHLEMVTPDQAAALGALGVVGSVQPAFDAAWGGPDGMYAARLGRERAMRLNPFATLAANGVQLAFGSDSPVTPIDPWGGVRAAVGHHTAGERLDLATAIAAHTVGGWRAAKRDDAGTLASGAPATYAVWETSSVEAALEETQQCLLTAVDGKIVFSRLVE